MTMATMTTPQKTAAETLRQIARLAEACARTDGISIKVLKAALEDISIIATKRADEIEGTITMGTKS